MSFKIRIKSRIVKNKAWDLNYTNRNGLLSDKNGCYRLYSDKKVNNKKESIVKIILREKLEKKPKKNFRTKRQNSKNIRKDIGSGANKFIFLQKLINGIRSIKKTTNRLINFDFDVFYHIF